MAMLFHADANHLIAGRLRARLWRTPLPQPKGRSTRGGV